MRIQDFRIASGPGVTEDPTSKARICNVFNLPAHELKKQTELAFLEQNKRIPLMKLLKGCGDLM